MSSTIQPCPQDSRGADRVTSARRRDAGVRALPEANDADVTTSGLRPGPGVERRDRRASAEAAWWRHSSVGCLGHGGCSLRPSGAAGRCRSCRHRRVDRIMHARGSSRRHGRISCTHRSRLRRRLPVLHRALGHSVLCSCRRSPVLRSPRYRLTLHFRAVPTCTLRARHSCLLAVHRQLRSCPVESAESGWKL